PIVRRAGSLQRTRDALPPRAWLPPPPPPEGRPGEGGRGRGRPGGRGGAARGGGGPGPAGRGGRAAPPPPPPPPPGAGLCAGPPPHRGPGADVRHGHAGARMTLADVAGLWTSWLGPEWGPPSWAVVKNAVFILGIIIPIAICVAFLTLWERKLIGWMQIRLGPNRVGPYGLLQPFADVLKLVFKEVIVPAGANKFLFVTAPMITLMAALAAWAVIPFAPEAVLADVNAGLLYVMAITSMGVYGVIIAGWASNSKYAFLGAMRSAAQIVAYEIAMGFALVCVLMVSQSLNLTDIVAGQNRG